MHYLSARIKNLLLAFFISATALSAQAQWVSIPDTNFGKWLNTHGYSLCLQGNSSVGWEMDTTCNEVVSDTSINCSSRSIKNLEGIQYFDNLKDLSCSYNELTSLPSLPKLLIYLDCGYNQLISLPDLPNSLNYLDCSYNQLTSLPALPNSLAELKCSSNNITSLPSLPNSLTELNCFENQLISLPVLPNTLTLLYCGNNQLISLPVLPNTLTLLYCTTNELTSLPVLPNTLTNLDCSNNQLTSLPALPITLTELDCSNNELISLPALPNSLISLNCTNIQLISLPTTLPDSLNYLGCGSNQLTSLPILPSSLVYLDCSSNQLTILPPLPNSLNGGLDCSNNQIAYLPSLPDSINNLLCYDNPLLSCLPKLGIVGQFEFNGTAITCLPNFPQIIFNSYPPLNTVPLCDVFNPKSCSSYQSISGTVFHDSIQNCIIDVNERHFQNVKLLLQRKGLTVQQSISRNDGTYTFAANKDTFEIRIDTTGLPYTVACPSTFFHTSILTPQDSIDTDKDFGLRCKPGFDVGVLSAVRDSGMLFPAQQGSIHVKAGDLSKFYGLNCAAGVSGAVSITYSGPVSFAGVMSGALVPVVSGNTLTYTIADFGAIDMQTAFGLRFLVDTFAQIGQQLCLDVVVTPTAGDNNVSNNTATYCFPIVNSYDPNMKEVSPVNSIAPDEDWLTYTIHFQNMGNAPAIHIYVMDTLDNNLDESSIQILGSSHRMLTEIKGNIARFNFPNINLVDSATNEPESKGWLQYKIKKNTGLALGTQIKNKASIYFDFNAPVVTNTVTNTVAEPSSIKENRSQLSDISVFPNPTNDVVYISYNSNTSAEVTLFNINGATCLKQQLTASNQSISLSGLPAGVYFISVEVQGSVVRKKVVKW